MRRPLLFALVAAPLFGLTCLPPGTAWAGRGPTVEEVQEGLRAGKPGRRIDALERAAEAGLAEAAPAIADAALRDPDPEVRIAALEALEQLGVPLMSATCQRSATEDPNPDVRKKALRILELLAGDEASGAVARAAAEDPDPSVRRKAVIILGKRGWKAHADVILDRAARDEEPRVVTEAWKALVRLGDPAHRPAIHDRLLHDELPGRRRDLARTIGEHPLTIDRDPLVAALDDPERQVRVEAAAALARLGDASVAPILREKARSADDKRTRKAFEEAAGRLVGGAAAR